MRIAADKVIYGMDKDNISVLKTTLPAPLTFETLDCFAGQLKSNQDTLEGLDFDRVNPATGPVYFEGVKAGDVLVVHIRDIRVNSPGIMVAAPGGGLLGNEVTQSETMLLDLENEMATFKEFNIPLNKMIGVIGLAPAGKAVSCGTPGSHGGNMDTTLITTGSSLYLPVQVDGGLLAMGDLHAAMGDGEIMVSGVEVSGEVDVTVTLAHDLKITNPIVVTPQVVATIASEETLDEAVLTATKDMANLLQQKAGLTLNEAGMLMSACGNAQISQVVDPQKTARFSMARCLMKKLGIIIAF